MKRFVSVVVVMTLALSLLGGCATNSATGEKVTAGAMIGGFLGGAIGFATTGRLEGALKGAAIGAALGAVTGFVIGKYEESQIQTRAEIYKEFPEYSTTTSRYEPFVKDLNPMLLDSENNPIQTFSGGQTIKLASNYTIIASPDVDKIDVEENNYLINPDETQTKETTRIKSRGVERISARQSITLPKELAPGNYTHIAIVRIGDKIEKKEQTITIAALNYNYNYAVAANRK